MACCCARRQRKVYATEQDAEARVQAVMAARREAKQQDERTSTDTEVGAVGRRASVGSSAGRRGSLSNRRGSTSFAERRGSLSNRRGSNSFAERRGSLSNRRGSNSFAERRGSLSNRRGSLNVNGAILTTQGFGAAAARRRSGSADEDGGNVGNRQGRRRRWSVESRSPLSPVTESPANTVRSLAGPEEDKHLPLIARAPVNRKSGTGTLARTRSGSQPHALSPKMRGTPAKGSSGKKSTMEMLLLMDNVSITDLHKAGTTLDELLLMGFGPKTLAAVKTRKSDGRVVPIFPLRDIKQNYKIDRRWLSDKVGMDANLLSRTVR
eukprot:COSAG02_NODE_1207_length_13885_cov_124.791237_17_plen_323_part_00